MLRTSEKNAVDREAIDERNKKLKNHGNKQYNFFNSNGQQESDDSPRNSAFVSKNSANQDRLENGSTSSMTTQQLLNMQNPIFNKNQSSFVGSDSDIHTKNHTNSEISAMSGQIRANLQTGLLGGCIAVERNGKSVTNSSNTRQKGRQNTTMSSKQIFNSKSSQQ